MKRINGVRKTLEELVKSLCRTMRWRSKIDIIVFERSLSQ